MTAAALQKRPKKNTLRDAMHQMEQRLCNRLDSQDKTLLGVINHMSRMEQRLTARLDKHDAMFIANTAATERVRTTVLDVEERLTTRINALEEDLTATMVDTIKIRTFVGMPLPEED